MPTNATIIVKRETSNYKQGKTVTTVGTYAVWHEEAVVKAYKSVNGRPVEEVLGSGMVILFNNITLTNCYLLINSVRRDIISFDRFTRADGTFHHIEVVYK